MTKTEKVQATYSTKKNWADMGDIGYFIHGGSASEDQYFTWGFTFTQMVFNGNVDEAYPWAKKHFETRKS